MELEKFLQSKLMEEQRLLDMLKKNAERVFPKSQSIREKRAWLSTYKTEYPCKCGEKNLEILHFHHLDSKSKISDVSTMVLYCDLEEIKVEVAKCEVLCEDCHFSLHRPSKKKFVRMK